MRIYAYRTKTPAPRIRPAPTGREWMDQMPGRHPYKCLPLQIANSHGWELLCPYAIEAVWDGRPAKNAIRIVSHGPPDSILAKTKFGSGVLSFSHGVMFRTEEPYALYVTGPVNTGKDGIFPLTALAETSWLPAQLPMNWKFTRAGLPVRFEEGEPFCHIFPLAFTTIEDAEPAWRDVDADPDLARQFESWRCTRVFANLDRKRNGIQSTFYRYYRQGIYVDGRPTTTVHRTRLRVQQFAETTSSPGVHVPRRSSCVAAAAWELIHANDTIRPPVADGPPTNSADVCGPCD